MKIVFFILPFGLASGASDCCKAHTHNTFTQTPRLLHSTEKLLHIRWNREIILLGVKKQQVGAVT